MAISWRRLKKNKLAMVGLFLLVLMILFCVFGPLFSPYNDITEVDLLHAKQAPSADHLLGTDTSGRDIFTRLMLGGRVSLLIGLVATALEIFIGAFLGCVSGYYGGKVDAIMMRVVDVVLSLPGMPILIMISAIFSDRHVPNQWRIYLLMLILAAIGWAGICRFFRGQVLTVREMDYMSATEAMGLHDMRKIFKHIMPNVFPLMIVTATLEVGERHSDGVRDVLPRCRRHAALRKLGQHGGGRLQYGRFHAPPVDVDAGGFLHPWQPCCASICSATGCAMPLTQE